MYCIFFYTEKYTGMFCPLGFVVCGVQEEVLLHQHEDYLATLKKKKIIACTFQYLGDCILVYISALSLL